MTGVVKICGCGRFFDALAWKALPLVGYQTSESKDPEEAGYELRNCSCASTLLVRVDLRTLLRASRDRTSSERIRMSAERTVRSYVEAGT
jgi:hypothetical protein